MEMVKKLSEIKPYGKNAKKHPKQQVLKIANSIKEFGFNQSIVVDKNNVIIVGHGRYEASKMLGLETVPVIQVDLDEDQAKAYRIADNKLNESAWESKLLLEDLKELPELLFEATGFDRSIFDEENDYNNPEIQFSEELMLEHNYVVLYFDNLFDWQVAVDKLGLKDVKTIAPEKSQKIGIARVIKGKEIIDKL